MMVIEHLRIDPWGQDERILQLPPDYEVLRVDMLPNGHYGLVVLYDGDEPTEPRLVHILTCREQSHSTKVEFPKSHRFLGSIHPDGFDTCYYLFDIGVAAPAQAS